MSSTAYASPLRLEWRPCARIALALGGLYGGGALLPWLAPLPWYLAAPVTALLLWRLRPALAVHAWLSAPQAPVALSWDAEGRWWLETRGGACLEGYLLPGAYVGPGLVVLAFRTAQGRRAVLLHAGRTDAEALRRLRVRLRLSAPGAGGNCAA